MMDRSTSSTALKIDMTGKPQSEKRSVPPHALRSGEKSCKKTKIRSTRVAKTTKYDKQQRYVSDSYMNKGREQKNVPLSSYAQIKVLSGTEVVNGKYIAVPPYAAQSHMFILVLNQRGNL